MTYKQNLQTVIDWREQIKQAVPDLKYKRVYTYKVGDNECRTTYWGISRDSWNKVHEFTSSDDFKFDKCCFGKVKRSRNTKSGMRYIGKLSITLTTAANDDWNWAE